MPKLDEDLYATLRSGGVRKRAARAAAKAADEGAEADLGAIADDLRAALAELDKRLGLAPDPGPRGAAAKLAAGTRRRTGAAE